MEENINKQYVVDASFVLSYLLPDENTKNTDRLFKYYAQGLIDFISNSLLPYEVLNSLKIATKQKRISKHIAIKLVDKFLRYKIMLVKIDFTDTFFLAQKEDLTFYDASYLSLAKSQNIPLLTLDKALSKFSEKK